MQIHSGDVLYGVGLVEVRLFRELSLFFREMSLSEKQHFSVVFGIFPQTGIARKTRAQSDLKSD